jgi:ADP-heptose:LPS heptosyltransferase
MKVLLVRADGLGDALVCAPLIAALRAAGHTLGIVLGTRNQDAFAPGTFAEVHVLERIPWPRHGSTPGSRRAALAAARAARYDIALIASEEVEAYRFARDARIPERAGFTNGWEKPLKSLRVAPWLTRAHVRPASAARERFHEVVTLFGLGRGLHGEPVPTRDLARLRPLLIGDPARPHGRVALQASAKFARAGLDAPAFVALARELRARGRSPLVLGDDPVFARAIAEEAGVEAELGLDVAAWKAAIAGASALVTPDSGAAHVAGMLGVPCIDCFAPENGRAPARWSPWAAPFRTVVLDPVRTPAQTGARLAGEVAELLGDAPDRRGDRGDVSRRVG